MREQSVTVISFEAAFNRCTSVGKKQKNSLSGKETSALLYKHSFCTFEPEPFLSFMTQSTQTGEFVSHA